jgi:hypothetical protein
MVKIPVGPHKGTNAAELSKGGSLPEGKKE